MKAILAIVPLFMSSQLMAAQCKVDIKNEIHLDGQRLEIHQTSGATAVVDEDNNLMIHGDVIPLDSEQKAAIEDYRESLNSYLPRAKKIANDGLELANEIIDDVSESFDAPDAFDGVKEKLHQFYADIESRYYKNGDLVLPAESFESLSNSWADDFEKAKQIFNEEFISSAFNAMSAKMKAEGGLNLTAMAESMAELKERVAKRLAEHAQEVEAESEEFCDSLDDMAEQEQQLHKKIPQLKDYQIFTI